MSNSNIHLLLNRRRALLAFCAYVGGAVSGCSNSTTTIKVEVEALPPEVDHIFACARGEDGRYYFERLTRGTQQWAKADLQIPHLPADYTGSLKVLFEARTADGCVLARDYPTVEFSSGQAQTLLTLPVSPTNPLASRVCKVSFISCGIGRGTPSFLQTPPTDGLAECPSDPAETTAAREVAAYVKYGEPFELGAIAGANSHFAAWVDSCPEEQGKPVSPNADPDSAGSACAGQGATCKLPAVTGPMRVRAQFNLGLCPPSGFCWENPLPQGNDLTQVWSPADGSTVVAVGAGGTVLHHDQNGWTQRDAGTTGTLHSVSGSSPSSIFAVGDGGAVRYFDGGRWQTPPGSNLTTEALNGIYASSPGAAFAVGANATLLLGSLLDPQKPWTPDNSKWSTLSANVGASRPQYRAVFGSAPSKVFALSGEPTVHIGGIGGWNTLPGQPVACGSTALSALWGDGTSYFLAGAAGTLMRFNGTTCTPETTARSENLNQVFGVGSERFAVGSEGLVLRQFGSTWQPVLAKEQRSAQVPPWTLTGGTASSASEYVIVGQNGLILRGNATSVTLDPETQDPLRRAANKGPISANLRAIAGQGNTMWAVGEAGMILYWDGLRWREESSPDDQLRTLNGLWVGATESWAVGDNGAILHRSGGAWKLVEAPERVRFYGVAATTTELWIVGELGRIYARPLNDSQAPFESRFPNASIKPYFAVWASGDLVCAVSTAPGTETNVLCGQGDKTRLVEVQDTKTQSPMYAIWGSGPADIWAAGDDYVLHRTGNDAGAWEKFGPYPGLSLRAVSRAADAVYAVGIGGSALSCRSPMGCTALPTGTNRDLYGLLGTGTGDLLAVGARGAILRNHR